MSLEGFVALQHLGKYAIFNIHGVYHELNENDVIEVDTGGGWIEMKVRRDFEGYYLSGKEISFYPKMVYARLTGEEEKEK